MPACKIPSFWLSPLMIAFLDRRLVDGVWLMVLKRGANSIYLRSMRDFISQRWWGHRSLHLNLRSNALDIGPMHFIRGLWRKKRSIIIIITLVTIAITTTISSSNNSININLFDGVPQTTLHYCRPITLSHCESDADDTVLYSESFTNCTVVYRNGVTFISMTTLTANAGRF